MRYESTKWLSKFISSHIPTLRQIWMEQCQIVHESKMLRIKVEDHYNTLKQVKGLHAQVDIEESSVVKAHRNRLNNPPIEILRAVACELLICLNVDLLETPF